jgi:hypothetical protein
METSTWMRREIKPQDWLSNGFDNTKILVFGRCEISHDVGSQTLGIGSREVIEAAQEHFQRDALYGYLQSISNGITQIEQNGVKKAR